MLTLEKTIMSKSIGNVWLNTCRKQLSLSALKLCPTPVSSKVFLERGLQRDFKHVFCSWKVFVVRKTAG